MSLAQARGRLDQAVRHLAELESVFARACREIEHSGTPLAASLESAVADARSAVLRQRKETAELADQARGAIRAREAAETLKTRRMTESAAREARKEERELEEANQT